MIELSAGKTTTKYKIYISNTTLTKKVLNQKETFKEDLHIKNTILKYENDGFKSLNKYVIKYQYIFKLFRKLIYKLKKYK